MKNENHEDFANNSLYTYRYIFRLKGALGINLSVSYYTGTSKQHDEYRERVLCNSDVESCIAEYVCSYDINFVGETYTVKEKEKEKKEDEEIC